jgi:hypothetical protein
MRYALLLCCAGLLAGCRTAQMPVPDALAASERLPVVGRQGWKIKEHLQFGSYEAHTIDRSWVRGSDLQVIIYEGNRRKQQYTFYLREGTADRWRVSCQAYLRKRSLQGGGTEIDLMNRSEVGCRLHELGSADGSWELKLDERGERPLEGQLTRGDEQWEVRGTRKLAGGLPAESTTGYEIGGAERPLGAVEVIGNGAVWLHEEAAPDQRAVIAAAAAALLLLEELRDHLSVA